MKRFSEIDESVWGGLLDKGAGDTKRKEDEINHLDMDDMCEYIHNMYEVTDDTLRIYRDLETPPSIVIPIFRKNGKIYKLKICFDLDKKIFLILLLTNTTQAEEVLNSLIKKFRVSVTSSNNLSINQKGDSRFFKPVTNQLCIDVIDTIIENAKEPLIKKKDE